MSLLTGSISVLILYYASGSADDEDTLQGVKGLEEALNRLKYLVKKIRVTKKNWKQAVKTPGDVVFNFVEDETWELYEKVAHTLESLGRAQVGHDKKSLRYSIEKVLIKKRLQELQINTPKFKIFTSASTINDNGLTYPLILKPAHEHAGIGISQDSVVKSRDELRKRVSYLLKHYPGNVIAEEYIMGREIHVTIMGNGKNLLVFPLCEIGFGGKFKKNWSIYTYKAKWDKKSWEYWDARVKAPANISISLAQKISNLAMRVYKTFGLRDIARIDVRIDEHEKPYIVDINMNPSLNIYDTEDATVASVAARKWSYDYFIKTLVAIAYKRLYG